METAEVEKFITDGWVIVNIPEEPIRNAIATLEAEAYLITGSAAPLSEMHDYIRDFPHFHEKLAKYFWEKEHGIKIAEACISHLKEIIGLELMVQYLPYVRIARPQRAEDNIGYHKDTQYGQSPYEIAIHVPFIDLDENSAINVISGTHVMSESKFTAKIGNSQPKDSVKHSLGYPYSPKCLNVPDGLKLTPLTMKVGQVAIFSPALFHGQEVNTGIGTRFTADIRVMDAMSCPKKKIGKGQNEYMPLNNSPVNLMTHSYYEAQNAS